VVRICIYGAGAIGGLIGGELARTGHEVSLICRGAQLDAIRRDGLTVIKPEGRYHVTPALATDDPAEAGPQDAVFMVMKAHHVSAAAERLGPLLGPDTPVIAVQNGIPWWYTHGAGGVLDGRILQSVDPGGRIAAAIGPGRVIGAVADASTAVPEPGVINHLQKDRAVTLGEPMGPNGARVQRLADALAETDIAAPLTGDIRTTVWKKLLTNAAVSQLCMLTRSTVKQLWGDPATRAVAADIMREATAVAAACGIDISDELTRRLGIKEMALNHKPSTLQDFEAGRPMEIDQIIGVVAEMGRVAGAATPTIDRVYAIERRLAENTGLYPGDGSFFLM
jgi:2-dehydropantoate 2-reductase